LPPDLDKELDRLYGVPLGDFVTERQKIERRLREEGRKEEADEVKTLAKPTTTAWVVNRLARAKRRDVDRLLAAGEQLRAAQGAAIAGRGTTSFEEAREAESASRQRLTQAAASLLAEGGRKASPHVLDQVDQTLRAAAVLDEGRELLARGRLVRELQTSGFDLLAGFGERQPRKKETAADPPPASERQRRLAEARADVKEARRRAREASEALRRAERDATAARRALDAAEASADEARREADDAAAALERAEEQLGTTRS
jgi:hypothetical protein